MSLAAGTRLGPYEIVSLLGAGGMGEVYKARDPRLGRDVAIKVLPESVAADLRFAVDSIADAQAAAPLEKPSDEKSIAVLPFEDLSPDRSQQPLCEGMAAEIINALGVVPGLRVISRISAARCREKGLDISEIGAHLNVATVLEGTVRKSGERLRISAQLVNTRDGGQLWATRYDRSEGDTFDIQDDIAAAIVDHLKVRLAASGRAPAVKRYTDNLEAYNL